MRCSRSVILILAVLLCLLPGEVHADAELGGRFILFHNRIIDLSVESTAYTSVTLIWTSPRFMPSRGPWVQYDLRYARTEINTEERWQAATPVAGLPPPQAPGTLERTTVIGLDPCTNYFFAIRAVDAQGSWSKLSNSPLGRTLCYTEGVGGGIGGLPAAYTAYPLTLNVNMLGRVASVRVSTEGELASALVAKDPSEKHTFELDKGTRVVLTDGRAPELLKFSEASVVVPPPENTVILGAVYQFTAHATALSPPSAVNISPSARLLLSYDPEQVPENAVEISIAYYDAEKGWQLLEPVSGAVAEVGKVHGMVSHFTPFAILARLSEPAPASFQVTRLVVHPTRVQQGEVVTVTVEVVNTGGRSGDYNLVLMVDGEVREMRVLTLVPGAIRTVEFTLEGEAPGVHWVEVAGLVGEFEVVERVRTGRWWWSVIVAVLAVVVIVCIMLRRKTVPR